MPGLHDGACSELVEGAHDRNCRPTSESLPLPAGEGWGKGEAEANPNASGGPQRFPLTLTLSRRERESLSTPRRICDVAFAVSALRGFPAHQNLPRWAKVSPSPSASQRERDGVRERLRQIPTALDARSAFQIGRA